MPSISSFNDYTIHFKNLHLYASKQTDERQILRENVEQMLLNIDKRLLFISQYSSNIDNTNLLNKFIDEISKEFSNLPEIGELELKYEYMIIDYLLITPLLLELNDIDRILKKIVEAAFNKFTKFVVLHELAVMSWYDRLISSQVVFQFLYRIKLNQKETFHLLGELSLRYPKEVIIFQSQEKLLDSHFQDRLVKKLYNSRLRSLSKDMEITCSLDEVKILVNQYLAK